MIPPGNIAVLKFGGSSLSSERGRIYATSHVRDALARQFNPVVVVSAMGRNGDPYSTDTLLSLVSGTSTIPQKDLDLLLSCGEIISAVVFSGILSSSGIRAMPLTGQMAGIVTDSNYGKASIIEIGEERILAAIRNGYVPVISGFQGTTRDGEVTTLGRGGSDITAMAIASKLGARYVCLFKDVDGVMTSDPKKSGDAVFMDRISAENLLAMVDSGSTLIHRKALEIAIAAGIHFSIRNTFPSWRETIVHPSEAGPAWTN